MIDRFVIKIMNEGMLTMKKLFALMLALALMLTVVCAFAEGEGGEGGGETGQTDSGPSITIETTSSTAEAAKDTTTYTWYRILEADIGAEPNSANGNQSEGAVSYHTDSEDKANALFSTGLFTVTRVGDSDRWYVELINDPTITGTQIAEAISGLNLSLFPKGTFSQTEVAGSAQAKNLLPGYYYIESTAGKNIAVQTLAAVTIKEKNEFPKVEKEVDRTDINAQIGDEITFTIRATIPATANDKIVLSDTMSAGLSYKSIDSVKLNGTEVQSGTSTYSVEPAEDNDGFTLTFTKAFIESAATQADSGTKTSEIEIVYKAILDGDAQTANPEKNSVVLKYGENYETVPKEAEVKTYDFKFNKIDGNTKDPLAGAEFQFMLDGTALDLVEIEEGKVYRIAMPDDENKTKTIKTNGETVRIYGLDTDIASYSLQETKAPTGGYNILKDPTPVKPSDGAFAEINVENNEGQVLPSTGGSGTTIFYVIGGLLIIGAAVVLVARRKAQE